MIDFSVVIPLYNKEKSVKSTIQSVLNQSYKNFELIIVNDGSTDKSLEVVSDIKDERIRIYSIPNGGVSNARNFGVSVSNFDYITFLDADDLWYENALEEFKILIDNFSEAAVYCTAHTLTIKHINSRLRRYYIDNYWKQNAISYARNSTAVMCTGSVAMRRGAFSSVSGFNLSLTHGEDLDLWKRLAEKFIFAKSEIVTMLYRLNAENRSDKTKVNNNIHLVKRNSVKNHFQRLNFGCIYFFELYKCFTGIFKLKHCLNLVFRYGDWIFLYFFLILYVRLLRK